LANKTPEHVRTWIEMPDVTVIVAEQDSAIVGIGAVSESGDILLNYVSPEARFQGVSKTVLVAMEKHLLQK
jgi:stringent starvation protein B